MGFASYREDDLTRFLAATDPSPMPRPRVPQHHCPFCNKVFDTGTALTAHLSSEHRGDRPVLVIAGREPDQSATIRRKPIPDDISIENYTTIKARLNGRVLQGITEEQLRVLLAEQASAILDIDLINEFEPAAAPVHQTYRIEMRIPDKVALDEIDRAFIEILAVGMPSMTQVAEFLKDPRCQGVVGDYADALAAYVRGLLIKDQALGTGVTLRPAEADELYAEALQGLKEFERPLAVVVCGLVRFAFNDFSTPPQETGFGRLDLCSHALSRLLGQVVAARAKEGDPKVGRIIKLCPVDQAVDRILELSERLARQNRWGPTLLEECEQAAAAETLTGRDRTKVLALWASTALRLGATEAAERPLAQLRNTYPFGPWAAFELDRMEEAGDGSYAE